MKVAVSATGPSLDSPIDPRFGRCQYLLIVDSDSLDFEAVENPAVMAPGGAGIQAAVGNGKGGMPCSEGAQVKEGARQALHGLVAAWAGRWCAAARAAGTRSRIGGEHPAAPSPAPNAARRCAASAAEPGRAACATVGDGE